MGARDDQDDMHGKGMSPHPMHTTSHTTCMPRPHHDTLLQSATHNLHAMHSCAYWVGSNLTCCPTQDSLPPPHPVTPHSTHITSATCHTARTSCTYITA